MALGAGLSNDLHQALGFLLEHVDPGLMYIIAGYGAFFALVGTHPVRVTDEKKALEIAMIHLRLVALVSIAVVAGLVIFMASFVSGRMYGGDEYWIVFKATAWQATVDSWMVVPLAWLLSWLVAFTWHRKLDPYLSSLFRRFRIRQTGDELSDIRVEQRKLKTKNFDPQTYYKRDYMFMGLDGENKPIYIKDEDFKSKNIKTIGPTQTGKGVAMGTWVDQAIRKGWTVIFVNPKPDRFIPNIMREACAAAGRAKPIQLDLNGVGSGKYGPFVAGTARQRRERLLWAAGLNDDGNQADFYKAGERAILDQLLPSWDGSVLHLHQLLHPRKSGDLGEVKTNSEIYKNTSRLRSYVTEWMAHKPLAASADRGLNLTRTIQQNGVAHIVSHTREKLVKQATTVLLMDLIQTIEGLGSQPRPHIFVVIDEVKFLISDTLAAGLATVLDKGCNMAVAYQAMNDLMALEDKRLNKDAIKQAVEVNCKLTLCYRAEDPDTAEWAATRSGTIQKKVASMEKVQQNRMGAEVWERERTLRATEENLLSSNKFLSLPDRVAGIFEPGHLGRLLYTCWVPVKDMRPPVESRPAPTEAEDVPQPGSIAESDPEPVEEICTEPPREVSVDHRIEPTISDELPVAPVETETASADDDAIKQEMRKKIRSLKVPAKPTIDADAALSQLLEQANKKGSARKAEEEKGSDSASEPDRSLDDELSKLNDDLSKL